MHPDQAQPLLLHDRLIIRRAGTFLRDHFEISSPEGQVLATVRETSIKWKRLIGLSRHFCAYDLAGDGRADRPVYAMRAPYSFFGDTFEVFDSIAGSHLATVKKRFFSLSTSLTLSIKGLSEIAMVGEFLGVNFSLQADGREIARVDTQFPNLSKHSLGGRTLALNLTPGLSRNQRIGVISAAVAIDLIMLKPSIRETLSP
nr:hypothetical protein [Corynebacterium lactis]